MKKFIIFFIALSLFSCNDGDFDVPEFQFTDDVNSCDEYLLYIASSEKTETMIMTLTSGQLGTTPGEKSYSISSSLPVIYRIFSEAIGSDYFCQAIPPTTPIVLKELDADSSGNVNIITTEVLDDQTVIGYTYEITISDLLFMDGSERIYFENFTFGTFEIEL